MRNTIYTLTFAVTLAATHVSASQDSAGTADTEPATPATLSLASPEELSPEIAPVSTAHPVQRSYAVTPERKS